MRKFVLRTSIVAFWIVLFLLILYWPRIDWRHMETKTISVFAWGDILDTEVIESFEKKTGIKVYLSYYSSNEELIVKLKATKWSGYDLIIPSDYAMQSLIRNKLLKPLDKSKLDFLENLNPLLLDKFYDPKNKYSLPFSWEVFGLGINVTYFQNHPFLPSWRLIFDRSLIDYDIGMINDPIEAVLLTSFYLHTKAISPIKHLLMTQRDWVAVYADSRADYLLTTKNCPVVVASSSYIWRTMRRFPFVQFVVPQEGTFISVENFAIPAITAKEDLVYRFMNFLYTRESSSAHFHTFGTFSATTHTMDPMDLNPLTEKMMHPSQKEFEKYHYTENLLPEDLVRDLWVEVKTH